MRNYDKRDMGDLVLNLIRLSERRYEPCYSDFLTEAEAMSALHELKTQCCDRFMLWGGFEAAQRGMLCVYPESSPPSTDDFPMKALSLTFRRSAKLTHRDFLGSLMGIGIKREAVGDIVISEGTATFFVRSELEGFVRAQIEKVGREGVEFSETGVDLSTIKQEFEERSGTVASLRIDAVIGECTGISRSKAQQIVKSGLAALNSETIYDTDHRVEDGDKLSVRGFGKYIIRFDGTMSKKGKLRIKVLKYI